MISQRCQVVEWMDRPDLDPSMHIAALHGLHRINSVTRSAAILWPALAETAKGLRSAPLRVLDVACGAGDNALAIARMARHRGVAVEVHGCDISPIAIAESRRSAAALGFDKSLFFQLDALRQPLPACFDVVTCSLFLHHLNHELAVDLIRSMTEAAERLVLVSDLRRTWLGLALAWAGSRLLTRSPVVHTDAVRSVAGAFVECEIESLVAKCGLPRCTITRHWPQRWLLRWERS